MKGLRLVLFRGSVFRVISWIGFVLWLAVSVAGARQERLIDGWRPLHYSVKLTLDDQLTTITSARAEITLLILKPRVTEIDLDFGEMTVDSVSINNASAEFEHAAGKLNLKLSQPFPSQSRLTVSVTYHGTPKDGLILSTDKDGKPSAVGDNWPNRVHHWIPCFDHPSAKSTVTFSVTAHGRNLVVANGRLERVQTTAGANRTWTYSERVPIPPYCMIIAVAQFAKLEPPKPTVTPLSYYVPQSDRRFAMQGFAPANPSLKVFTQTVAPYPYEKLALIVGATRFGGMENSGAIVFTSNLFASRDDARPISSVFKIPRRTVNLIAHEIAHQWFGDSVTESTWADFWLSEGFATYFAGLFLQKVESEKAFQDYMKETAETYLRYARNNRTPIFDTETEDLNRLLNANNYQKGAWVLHMLRSVLGDKAFFRGIRTYYRNHKNSTASSEDLRAALERASGVDLRQFFKSWVYGGGHPHYEFSWQWDEARRVIKVRVNQLQAESYFANPLPISVVTARGTRRVLLRPVSKETVGEFRLNGPPSAVHFDPDNQVLKEIAQARAIPAATSQ
ncbi:MAG TPA: M1 family metallopeptidase [Pyrinomonadaceae bacterium]|nr:M1 family metallopeptidase [Pyrinomonadaceae bacterium]